MPIVARTRPCRWSEVRSWLRSSPEHDPITALPSRSGLHWHTHHHFTRKRDEPLGLLLVGLDHFATINETYGDDAGDDLLRQVAARAHVTTEAAGAKIGRWGSDELVAVFPRPHVGEVDLSALAEQLRVAIAAPMELADRTVRLTASVGAALCHCGACAFADLFRHADRRLVAAKQAGRNRIELTDCLPPVRQQVTRPLVTTVIQRHT